MCWDHVQGSSKSQGRCWDHVQGSGKVFGSSQGVKKVVSIKLRGQKRGVGIGKPREVKKALGSKPWVKEVFGSRPGVKKVLGSRPGVKKVLGSRPGVKKGVGIKSRGKERCWVQVQVYPVCHQRCDCWFCT